MLIRLITEDHQGTVELMRRDYARQINWELKETENIQREIQLRDAILANIRQRKKVISREVEKMIETEKKLSSRLMST
jgi:hypothetical protein